MRVPVAVLASVGLLLPLVAASAEAPILGELRTQGMVTLQGELRGTMDAFIVRFDAGSNGGNATLALDTEEGAFFLDNYPFLQTTGPVQAPLPLTLRKEALQNGTFHHLEATTVQGAASLRILPLSGGVLHVPLAAREATVVPDRHPPLTSEPFEPDYRGRELDSHADSGNAAGANLTGGAFEGDVLVMLYGARLDVDGVRFDTGQFPRPGTSVADPLGINRVDGFDRRVLVAVVPAASIRLGAGAWSYELSGLRATGVGDAAFEAAKTHARVNGTQLRESSGLLHVLGTLTMTASYGSDGGAWHVEGTATAVLSEGRLLFGGSTWAAAAGVAGIGLLALLAARFGFLALRHRGGDPLTNPNRVRVLRTIGENPGATAMDLARATGLHRSTVNFHVEVLRRAGRIDAQRLGRFEHFHLNSSSYRFPTRSAAGEAAGLVATEFFSTIRHPGRRQVFHALLDAEAPLTYQELAARWAARGEPTMKRTTFLHHVCKLEQGKLVQRSRVGKATAWRLGVDYAGTLHTQARLFLAAHGRQEVLDAVAAQGSARPETVASRLGVPDALECLRELHAVGFLHRDAAGAYTLNHGGVFRYINEGRGA